MRGRNGSAREHGYAHHKSGRSSVAYTVALYDKLRREKNIVINGFRKVGIVEVVRQALPSTEDVPAPDGSEDQFVKTESS